MSYVTRILTQLPFGHIIGAPMEAAIKAQALAAKSTVEFIQAVGFKQSGDNVNAGADTATDQDFGEVRNLTFKYKTTDNGTDNQERNVELTVPVLTVVPIPFLRIDEMTIDFTAKITEEIKSDFSKKSETDATAKIDAGYKAWWSPVSVNFNASISTKHSSSASASNRFQTECTMNIHVRCSQSEIPVGLGRILNILETSALRNK